MKKYCDGLSGRLKPTLVNYPPLDLKHFSPGVRDQELCTELGISPADKVITYMGSFFYFSGLPEVIRAFATQVGKDTDVKLLLIGGGEQEKELLALVSELELNDRVIFTGFVPYVQLPKYLRISDVAINPLKISTVASVAFPHKVLQYLATGLPVVSSRLDGLVAALDGIQGLFWVDSPEACMSTALEMIRNAKGPIDMNLTEDALDALLAPESALKSLTETLSLAISNQTRK
jgi:glycosyltransferase involved in cell wall biosynthesis